MDPVTGGARSLVEPAPAVDAEAAAALAAERFGIVAAVDALPAERDRNFLLRVADGRRLVLKVSHSAEDPAVVAMETAAMRHVERIDPGLAVPRIVGDAVEVRAGDGRTHLVRLITVVPGMPADGRELPERFAEDFGAVCARLARALRGFTHPAAARVLDWDPRDVSALRPALGLVPDPGRRKQVEGLLDRFDGLRAATLGLPASVLHGDATPGNVLVDGDGAITGVIDFGDLHHTARVADLAVSLCALLRVAPETAAGFLDGYQRGSPLEPEEVDVLGHLVLARAAAGLLMSGRLAALHPGNRDYVSGNDAGNARVLDMTLPPFHRICGTARVGQRADATLLPRRAAALGGELQPLFPGAPIQVARAAGAYVYAADGRRYLDAYNNVPVVGHAHPAVVQAIARQSAVLNINSRYLHPNAVELAERLLATMPPELDTCVFANSGSEVNDLAWRMAKLCTGHTGAIVTDHAYHGVSDATAVLSTNAYPASARPPHVAVFRPPLPGLADAPAATAAVRGAVADLRASGHEVALLAVDTVFSSGGILEPEPGYVPALLAETRAAGGLLLADEVQAGFGRGGSHLWRFQDFGVVPDIVTLGKPMGNGHPVAALITRREIADRFASFDEYFSTYGGNPVSCAAALTVLDIIEDRGLVEHCGRIGTALRAGLQSTLPFPVRGPGLMIGVQVGPGARELASRLGDAGVLVGTTGYGGDTLKIRPPLIWTEEHLGRFLTAMAHTVAA